MPLPGSSSRTLLAWSWGPSKMSPGNLLTRPIAPNVLYYRPFQLRVCFPAWCLTVAAFHLRYVITGLVYPQDCVVFKSALHLRRLNPSELKDRLSLLLRTGDMDLSCY